MHDTVQMRREMYDLKEVRASVVLLYCTQAAVSRARVVLRARRLRVLHVGYM
jgi:hypothetical protein